MDTEFQVRKMKKFCRWMIEMIVNNVNALLV
jgi:hypothetical protein